MAIEILDKLFCLQDLEYKNFHANLIPNIDINNIIGIKMPVLRSLAKSLTIEEKSSFIDNLPHKYYDENMLHGIILSEIKDYDEAIKRLDEFIPYIDNWAVCDTIKPKAFNKNKDKLILKIKEWLKSDYTYSIRFGISMLMTYYLDDDYKKEYLKYPLSIKSDEYYVNMMIAWYFATALTKRWDDALNLS